MQRRSGFKVWRATTIAITIATTSGAVWMGCEDSSGTVNIAPFLGDWTVTTSSLNVMCGGLPLMQPVTGTVTVSPAATAPLKLSFTDPALAGCTFLMDASGTVATVRGGQTCPVAYQGYSGAFTVTVGMMTVMPTMGSLSFVGTASVMLGNIPLSCSGNFSGSLTKGLVDAGTPSDGAVPSDAGTGADTAGPMTDSSASFTDSGAADAPAGADAAATDAAGGGDAVTVDAPAVD